MISTVYAATHDSLAEPDNTCHNIGMDLGSSDLAQNVASIVFLVLLIIYIIHGLFLGYHWFNYGTSNRTSSLALTTYLIGGAVLFTLLATIIVTL